ncbi:MAG: hypothetical protein F6K10_32475 [Moorea sp. SIO2B7]|nr:hypothetical protein [Moorena sp. SIO2B7]
MMAKFKAKRKTKKKKRTEMIPTDVWVLKVTSCEKKLLLLTVREYRKFLKPLVFIVNAEGKLIGILTEKEKVNWIEKYFHVTSNNPNYKYYYQKVLDKYPSFPKFPSYLIRAAIADAIGIVSSFKTRYLSWQSGNRFRRTYKPHRLTVMCQNYPDLYKGKQILYGDNYQNVALKVLSRKDCIWGHNIVVKNRKNRHLG